LRESKHLLNRHLDMQQPREGLARRISLPVRAGQTLPKNEAVKEKGFLGNQNSAAKPRAKRWLHTVQRLKKRFKIGE